MLDDLFDLDEIRVTSRRPESREKFAAELSAELSTPVRVVATAEEAFDGADVLVEATRLTEPEPLLRTAAVKPGAFVVPYGTISAVELDLLDVMDKVVVDDWREAQSGRFGSLRRHVDTGRLSPETLYAELGEIVAGRKPGRENDAERNLFWHRGLSLLDVAIAHLILRKAEAATSARCCASTDDQRTRRPRPGQPRAHRARPAPPRPPRRDPRRRPPAPSTPAEPVYGVNTGMGNLSKVRLTEDEQRVHQRNLLLGRAVGGPPWLPPDEARAVLIGRLRTFLTGDAGVSVELIQQLVACINSGQAAEDPRRRSRLGRRDHPAGRTPSAPLVTGPGAFELGPKEGIALLAGIPGATGRAALHATRARRLADHLSAVAAGAIAVIGANRAPYHPAAARGDDLLAAEFGRIRELAGPEAEPRALQAPVSFRVAGHVHRACPADPASPG